MLRSACIALLLLALSGCTQGKAEEGSSSKAQQKAPELGACRTLAPEDIRQASNTSPAVSCAGRHTAETFAVGTFPDDLVAGDDPDDPKLGAYVYDRCQGQFQKFLGGDESLVLRSTMTWAWFRPTTEAWNDGAHWYRCDVVGGGEQSKSFVALPRTAKGSCSAGPTTAGRSASNGPSVSGSVKIPCTQAHTWRAVTTIVLGKSTDPYPGDRLVEVRTRDFCSDSVGAWLNYPVDYDYGYTWFHEAEWKAGNRRSICWAKTDQ